MDVYAYTNVYIYTEIRIYFYYILKRINALAGIPICCFCCFPFNIIQDLHNSLNTPHCIVVYSSICTTLMPHSFHIVIIYGLLLFVAVVVVVVDAIELTSAVAARNSCTTATIYIRAWAFNNHNIMNNLDI